MATLELYNMRVTIVTNAGHRASFPIEAATLKQLAAVLISDPNVRELMSRSAYSRVLGLLEAEGNPCDFSA